MMSLREEKKEKNRRITEKVNKKKEEAKEESCMIGEGELCRLKVKRIIDSRKKRCW